MRAASMEEKNEKASTELRQKGIQRTLDQLRHRASTIMSFTLQWKEMEDHLEYTRNSMEERASELRAIQDSIKERLQVAEKKEEELGRIRVSVEERFREIEAREKEFELSQKGEIEERRREIEWIEKSGRELNAVRDLIEKKLSEVEELEEKYELLNSCVEERVNDVNVVEGKVNEKIKEIEVKEKEIELKERELELKEKEIEARCREVELKEKKLEECLKEVELKEKGIEERCREEKKFKEVKIEPLDDNCDMDYLADDASIRFWLKMDGKDMQIFLNERWEQHHKMGDEVEIALRRSADPAKLVLDALQGFYPPHLKKGAVEFDEGAVRSSCSVLLEQLMKISPLIKPHVREEAMKLAFDWMTKMRKDAEHPLEVLGFLQLLTTYGLTSAFDADDLLNCLKIVAQHSQGHELARITGFADNVSGWDLQIFLNERPREHNSLRNVVKITLGLSSDPAKLALDAMQGFYPPHLKKGDVEFEAAVVRWSCIILLEVLMEMSPQIRLHVRKEAMGLAFDWMTKMRKDAEHSQEVLGFLQLLATYDLASAFNADELLNYLEIVTQFRQSPELARVLGFADKVSGIVQSLIGKNQQNIAIKFVYAFELINEFPIVSVLKAYLKYSLAYAKQIRRKNKTPEGEFEATTKRIDALRAVLKCIEDHKIESEISPERLKQDIDFLEKVSAMQKTIFPSLCCAVQPLYLNENKCFASDVVGVAAPALPHKSASTTSTALASSSATASITAPALSPRTPSQQQSGIKCPRMAASAEDDPNAHIGASVVTSIDLTDQQVAGLCADQASCSVPFHVKNEQRLCRDSSMESKEVFSSLHPQPKPKYLSVKMGREDLRWLLIKHGNYELMRSEIFDALQHACDPAKLVLDEIKSLYSSKLKVTLGISNESCILLLEQLRRVSPQIMPSLKCIAIKFAYHWKSKLTKNTKDPLEVICFLQFLAAYGLASSFNADEILVLLDTDHWRRRAPDLCQVLGLADVIPNFIQNLIKRKQFMEAIKYIYSLDVIDKFALGPLLNDYLSCCSKQNAEKLSNTDSIGEQIGVIERKLEALKAVVKCVAHYKIQSEFSHEILIENIMKLEKEKKLIFENSKTKNGPCSPTTSKLSDQQSQKKYDTPVTAHNANITTAPITSSLAAPARTLVISSSLTTASVPANIPMAQQQQQSRNKRPRIDVSSNAPPQAPATSMVDSMQLPYSQPLGWFMNQGDPDMNASAIHYNLSANPPINVQSSSSYPNVILYYKWNTFGNPGLGHDRPVPF